MHNLKNILKNKLSFIIILFLFSTSKAQISSINQGTINEKFNYIISNSEVINDTRIIKNWWIFTLKNSVNDTLKILQEKIKNLNDSLHIAKNKIDSLENIISEKLIQLNNLESRQNSILLLGKAIDKKTYNKILFSIITILFFLLFITFLLYKRSNRLTIKFKKDIEELNEEFEKYRKKTLEREQKIVREMYDEILKYKNKLNELSNK